jgi:hypothetical protein
MGCAGCSCCDVIVCYGGAKPTHTHLASIIHCIDDEIIEWLQWCERNRIEADDPNPFDDGTTLIKCYGCDSQPRGARS